MQKKTIICTCCPMGCHMEVLLNDGKITNITGNTCKRGANYANDEITCPKRTFTGTVRTDTGKMLSVKTQKAIPLEKMSEAMKLLCAITPKTPVKIGDIICKNFCGTGINLLATKNL